MKIISIAALVLLSTLSYAEEVPNSFSSGETISSSQINANFSFLADAMAQGKITAMMICKDIGISDYTNQDIGNNEGFIKPTVAFGNCIAPDNTSLVNLNICHLRASLQYGNCQSPYSKERSIYSNDLITNDWLLYLIEVSKSGSDEFTYYYFYKISDQ